MDTDEKTETHKELFAGGGGEEPGFQLSSLDLESAFFVSLCLSRRFSQFSKIDESRTEDRDCPGVRLFPTVAYQLCNIKSLDPFESQCPHFKSEGVGHFLPLFSLSLWILGLEAALNVI